MRQDLAIAGVERDRAGRFEAGQLLAQQAGDLALERQVERQQEVLARPGAVDPQHPQLAAGRVDLGALLTGPAAQLGLAHQLDAHLADLVVGRVVAVRVVLELGVLVGVDPADHAEHVAGQPAVDVLADRLDEHLDAGQLEVALLDRVGEPGVDAGADRDRRERVAGDGAPLDHARRSRGRLDCIRRPSRRKTASGLRGRSAGTTAIA